MAWLAKKKKTAEDNISYPASVLLLFPFTRLSDVCEVPSLIIYLAPTKVTEVYNHSCKLLSTDNMPWYLHNSTQGNYFITSVFLSFYSIFFLFSFNYKSSISNLSLAFTSIKLANFPETGNDESTVRHRTYISLQHDFHQIWLKQRLYVFP